MHEPTKKRKNCERWSENNWVTALTNSCTTVFSNVSISIGLFSHKIIWSNYRLRGRPLDKKETNSPEVDMVFHLNAPQQSHQKFLDHMVCVIVSIIKGRIQIDQWFQSYLHAKKSFGSLQPSASIESSKVWILGFLVITRRSAFSHVVWNFSFVSVALLFSELIPHISQWYGILIDGEMNAQSPVSLLFDCSLHFYK